MKNLSLALNAVLLLAVGFLYYKQFSGTQAGPEVVAETSDSVVAVPTPPVVLSALPKDVPLVFINTDSIFANYELAIKTKKQIENKIAEYRRGYDAKVEKLQSEYDEYVQKAGAGAYTKEQGLKIEAGLQQQRDAIVEMEQKQEKVLNDMEGANMEVRKSVYDYLVRFNKENGYYCTLAYTPTSGVILGVKDSLDVTRQVVAGLNSEYKTTKSK